MPEYIVDEKMKETCKSCAPKMLQLIGPKNFFLFLAFLEREVMDYTTWNIQQAFDWLTGVLERIDKEVKPVYEVQIRSYGITELRSMALDTTASFSEISDDQKIMEIRLCTCGKLNHWGRIIYKKNN